MPGSPGSPPAGAPAPHGEPGQHERHGATGGLFEIELEGAQPLGGPLVLGGEIPGVLGTRKPARAAVTTRASPTRPPMRDGNSGPSSMPVRA